MTLRIVPFPFLAVLLWTAISALSGFVASRYIIDAELRRTDACMRHIAEDLDRHGLAMTQHVLHTTRVIDQRIDSLAIEKEHRK